MVGNITFLMILLFLSVAADMMDKLQFFIFISE